ncbi:MAG: DUF488 family protein [Candidatus Korobacteraceae bacterium]
MTVAIKRVYEEPSPQDGLRVLVDRLWPRGLKKDDAALDAWLKDLAPSNELRKWYHAHPEQWSKFRERYLKELASETATTALEELYRLRSQRRRLTLLFASKNEERNNATVLKQLVDGERKPPTGTGPIRAASGRLARVAQRR